MKAGLQCSLAIISLNVSRCQSLFNEDGTCYPKTQEELETNDVENMTHVTEESWILQRLDDDDDEEQKKISYLEI